MKVPDTSTKEGQIEASAMLARARGWSNLPDQPHHWRYADGKSVVVHAGTRKAYDRNLNLYDLDNMAIAWDFLLWAHTVKVGYFKDWPLLTHNIVDESLSASDAVRWWLDVILARLVGEGLINEPVRCG